MSKDSLLGLRLSNYEIKQQIGHGGMAKVYYAVDVNLERPAAVKVIDTRFRGDPEYARRFIDEAKTVATWRHENIIQVYYADQVDEIYFFAMEYIDGASLGELLDAYMDDGELMPHEDALRIGRRVASALDYAHDKGVIHRDVKPSNVMIATDDRVILTDFGLALDVQQGSLGEIFGTPHYASPEQARRSSDAVPQSDVYSFGVMMYEILTGVVPFDDESVTAIAVQHLSEDPPPPRSLNPKLNEATEAVLLKTLAKRPEDRYPTATAFIKALDDALQQPAASNPPPPPPVMPPAALDASRKSKAGGKLSAMSVAQKMAQQIQQRPQPPVPGQKAKKRPQHADKTVKTSAKRSRTPLRIMLLLLLILAGMAVAAGSGAVNIDERLAFLSGLTGSDDSTPTAVAQDITAASVTPAATDTSAPTRTPAQSATQASTPTTVPVQVTDAPTLTAVRTDTPTPLPTFTPPPPTATTAASATPLRLPTLTPVPPTSTTLPDTGTPVRYPNGRTLELYWNNDSFYVHNTTNDSIRIAPLSFEAIGADGNRLSRFSFSGARWTQFWHSIESNKCNGIEEGGNSNPLRPGACRGYNARLLPQDGEMFWTGERGSSAFALLWHSEEIARCRIEAGVCAVNIPPG